MLRTERKSARQQQQQQQPSFDSAERYHTVPASSYKQYDQLTSDGLISGVDPGQPLLAVVFKCRLANARSARPLKLAIPDAIIEDLRKYRDTCHLYLNVPLRVD